MGGIKAARCSERNLSLARNMGAALAAGEILTFIDDDAVPEAGMAHPDRRGVR